jgi:hypothetical protein
MRQAYLRVIHEIHKAREHPFALHEIKNVGDTTKLRVMEILMILKLVAKYPRSYNHRKYQVTKAWDTELEVVRLYEIAATLRKPYNSDAQASKGLTRRGSTW